MKEAINRACFLNPVKGAQYNSINNSNIDILNSFLQSSEVESNEEIKVKELNHNKLIIKICKETRVLEAGELRELQEFCL